MSHIIPVEISPQCLIDLFSSIHMSPLYTGAWVDSITCIETVKSGNPHLVVRYTRPEDEEGEFKGTKVIKMPDIIEGLAKMAKGSPEHFGYAIRGEGDAVTSDVFLQFVVLREEVYG